MLRRFSLALGLVALFLAGWANVPSQVQAFDDPTCDKECGCGSGNCSVFRSCGENELCWTCECDAHNDGCEWPNENYNDTCDGVQFCETTSGCPV